MTSIYEQLSQERKQLQIDGLLPEWVTTGGWQLFKAKYLYKTDRAYRGQVERIARTAAQYTYDPSLWYERFFGMIWKGWVSCSTPVLANMGTDRGMPVSCSGNVVEDSIDGFYTARHEIAMLTKYGFGTASYLGDIRPRGSEISNGGTADGILPVLQSFVQDMRRVSQGTARRGAWAGYIPIDHGDFYEVCGYLAAEPDDLNIGWCVSNGFIARMNAGDTEAIDRYQRAMKVKADTGKGYFFFNDKANLKRPECYVNNNLFVKASQLCFSGDTLVAVADGRNAVRIDTLAKEGGTFTVYSGVKSKRPVRGRPQGGVLVGSQYKTVIRKAKAIYTGTKELVRVHFEDGDYFDCTPDHKLASTVYGQWVEAQDAVNVCLEPFASFSVKKEQDWRYAQTDVGQVYKGRKVVRVEKLGEQPVYDVVILNKKIDYNRRNFYIITSGDKDYRNSKGVLVHNCSEIMLHSDAEHTYTCVLSSLNAIHWEDWKDTDVVKWATYFLDCVAEHFIQQSKTVPGMDKARRATEKGRALGLGLCGLHSLYQKKSFPFASFDAHMLNIQIFKKLDEDSLAMSQELAKIHGEPEWCKGFGIRNTHRIAVAPTMSTALLMGGVSQGIEPIVGNVFTQDSAAGEIERVNPVFLELMKERGTFTKEICDEIASRNGSVQHLDWLSPHEKDVFRTAYETDARAIMRQAKARAKHIDQWQSLNLFFSAEEKEEYISEIHQEAFMDPDILALYYMRTQAGVQASKGECEACT